jgi:putative endonuclease
MAHFVYILANKPHGAIYIGATSDLKTRIAQHRNFRGVSHTNRYSIKTLVYFEQHEHLQDALVREQRLKRWRRVWKDQLIAENNPHWQDISGLVPI